MDQSPRGIIVAALLIVTFGTAEVTTGFTHNFFGISTAMGTTSAYIGAVIGVLYAAAGLLVLSMKRRGRRSPLCSLSLTSSGASLWL